MAKLNRRTFVLGGLAVAGSLALPARAVLAATPYPFKLGVASGEPASDSVVLWTRLAPSPLNTDGQGGMANADVAVDWQVSESELFDTLIASGTVTARYAAAHSVHVVAGGLSPDSEYYYRFRAQGQLSAVGHTRTTPATGTFGSGFKMAFASCSHYEAGYFTAYRRIADDQPDVVLHLGDYIYESEVSAGTAVRLHTSTTEPVSLANYRLRYAQYRTDPDLQAAHAVAPWLVVPDDHEVENNYANMARNDNSPVLTTAQWTARRTAAYQAYYENMPLRPSAAPAGNSIALYRRVRWGSLATFHLLDTRQYRDDQACSDGWKVCAAADDTARSLPGTTEEAWLLDGFEQHLGTWDVIAQQVFFAMQKGEGGTENMDAWDGYRASRDRIQQGWVDRDVRNPVVLTGDVHRGWACDLKADYADPGSARIGAELVCTSITSEGDGTTITTIPYASANPHIKYYSERRGYTLATVTADRIRADWRTIAKVTEHGAAVSTAKSFVILDGHPGLQTV